MKLTKAIQSRSESMSVRQKGLILVSIPLAFQLLFTLALGLLYAQAENDALREAQSRVLSIRINTLVKDIWDEGELLLLYNAFRKEELLDKYTVKRKAMIDELDSIKKLVIQSQDSVKVYGKLLDLSNKGIVIMDRVLERAKTSGASSIDILAELRSFLRSVSTELETTLTEDLRGTNQNWMSREQTRQFIATVLYLSVIADVAIAIALSAFFSSGISQRLFVIADNTRRLKERQALNPSLEGSDEIAQLDAQFHSLVLALKESEALRSEFISMTSHDLKTPLMSVELSLELIERQLSGSASAATIEELAIAKDNMQRVLGLINDLLDLERGVAGKLRLDMEDVDLTSLIKRSVQSVQALAKRKNISINYEVTEEELAGDRRRLEQVLVNLLSNALKFSAENSEISILTAQAGGFIEIKVRDSGPGIPESDIERVFERFEQSQAKSSNKDYGSGLGLAICKTIVEAHGGQIGVVSQSHGGSEFWFRIPQAK